MSTEKRMSGEDRKLCILSAVRGLFSRKGLNVTSKELSKAAGVSEALIYKHFSSKEEMYLAMIEMCCQGHQGASETLSQGPPSTERFIYATAIMIQAMTTGMNDPDDPNTPSTHEINGLVMHSLRQNGEVARTLFQRSLGPWVLDFTESHKAGVKEGFITQGPISAKNIVWIAHHAIMGNKMTMMSEPDSFMGDFNSEEQWKQELLVFCLRGMGVDPKKLDQVLQSYEFKQFQKTITAQGAN